MAVADHIDKIIVNGTELSINDTNARAMLAPQYADLTFPVAKGQHCIHINDLCEANQDISTSEAWTAAHWDVVTVGHELAEMGDDITSIGNDVDDLKASAVLYGEAQTLTEAQRGTARANIKAVGYDSQSLTDMEKTQARGNIGAGSAADVEAINEAIDDLGFSVVDGKLCVTYDA